MHINANIRLQCAQHNFFYIILNFFIGIYISTQTYGNYDSAIRGYGNILQRVGITFIKPQHPLTTVAHLKHEYWLILGNKPLFGSW